MSNDQPASSPDPYLVPAFPLGHRLRRALWNAVWLLLFRPTPRPLFRWRAFLLRVFGARLSPRAYVYPGARIWAPWLLETGELVTIGEGAEIYNPGGVRLEHHVIVSQQAYLCGATHDFDDPNFPMTWQPIIVGPYAWICARAIVLPGVVVGEGAVLGAGAVTSRSLDAWGVYAGNPARKLRERERVVVK